ncbi:MAG: preprotein translocase subunit YajC [Propionibacteriales bacterium]|nr:preprotein translocase subunit YajC [Propionibacteriales bacterium]
MEALANLVPLLLIVGVFWMLIWRPQRRKQAAVARLRSSLDVGDRVMLGSGIYAQIRAIRDDGIQVEVAPDVLLRVHRDAVVSKENPEPAPHDETEPSDDSITRPKDEDV